MTFWTLVLNLIGRSYSLLRFAWELDQYEVRRRIQIVFSRLINNPKVAFFFGGLVGKDPGEGMFPRWIISPFPDFPLSPALML